jgi:KUP system potassium uptake protein
VSVEDKRQHHRRRQLIELANYHLHPAMITATYTLVHQLIAMESFPAVRISYTSNLTAGQVYVPAVNWFLMIATIATVAGFGSSSALTLAYG